LRRREVQHDQDHESAASRSIHGDEPERRREKEMEMEMEI
jgi:hypothetical protein